MNSTKTNHPTPADSPQMGWNEWGILVLLSVLWGGSFLFAKVALREIEPLTLVLFRVALAAIVLALVLELRSIGLPSGVGLWRRFAVMGLLNNALPFALLFWGQTRLGAGLAATLTATTPLFTAVLAHVLTTDERLNRPKVAGLCSGFAGAALLLGLEWGQGFWWVLSMFACIGASVTYALAALYGRAFQSLGVKPIQVAFGQVTASAVIMLPLALGLDGVPSLTSMSTPTVAAICSISLLSTALAYVLFFHVLSRAGATNITLVTFLIPVSALLLSALLLNEALLAHHYFGLGLILFGLGLIDGRLHFLVRRRFL